MSNDPNRERNINRSMTTPPIWADLFCINRRKIRQVGFDRGGEAGFCEEGAMEGWLIVMEGLIGQLDTPVNDLVENIHDEVKHDISPGADQDNTLGDAEVTPLDGFNT